MRKVVLQMTMTLDGLVAGPHGEMDWVFSSSDKTTQDYAHDLLDGSDQILLGRGMAKEFLDYWPTHELTNEIDKKSDIKTFAGKINILPKVIFSKTLDKAEWPKVTIAKDIASEISRLKSQPGKNLILYGGAGLVHSFIDLNMIDEYHLMVAPIILGKGLSLFANLKSSRKLYLIKTTNSKTGVVILHYEPAKE